MENSISEGNPDDLSDIKTKRSTTLSKSFWAAQHKTCQYVQTEERTPIVPPLRIPVKRDIIFYEAKEQPGLQTVPIPLFVNYPSLSVKFTKLLPAMTPSNIRTEVFRRFGSARFGEIQGEDDTQRQDDSSLQTKLNRLKKLNKSLTKENLKLRDTQKYCSGCKVELLFNSDREMDTKTNTT